MIKKKGERTSTLPLATTRTNQQAPAGITAKIATMPSPDALVHVQTAIDRELCTCGIATLITG